MLRTRNCPYCGGEIDFDATRCRFCRSEIPPNVVTTATGEGVVGGGVVTVGGKATVHGGIHVTYSNWSEFQQVPDETKRKLKLEYETQLASFPKNADLLIALALSYLDLGLYPYARSYFERARSLNPRDPQTLYYLALTSLNGHRPKNQSLQTIELIQQYLTAAMSLDSGKAHVPMLAAIVKYDYYLTNGLTPPIPSIEQLLRLAVKWQWNAQEMQAIARFAALPPDLAREFRLI